MKKLVAGLFVMFFVLSIVACATYEPDDNGDDYRDTTIDAREDAREQKQEQLR